MRTINAINKVFNTILQTKWPSDRLPEKIKMTLRFMLIGAIGSLVQTGFFLLLMLPMGNPAEYTLWWYIAFAGGFILEMFPNYFMMCCYTFRAAPNKTNASGFVLARAINLVLQMVVLPLSKQWLMGLSDAWISFIVIFVAGIANFVIQYIFFNKKKKKK